MKLKLSFLAGLLLLLIAAPFQTHAAVFNYLGGSDAYTGNNSSTVYGWPSGTSVTLVAGQLYAPGALGVDTLTQSQAIQECNDAVTNNGLPTNKNYWCVFAQQIGEQCKNGLCWPNENHYSAALAAVAPTSYPNASSPQWIDANYSYTPTEWDNIVPTNGSGAAIFPVPYMYVSPANAVLPNAVYTTPGTGLNWLFGYNGAPPAPTATLTANPTTVQSGNASALTWSSTNATSCTGTNFTTGGATSGGPLSTGALTATKTYSIQCTGAGGVANAQATVTVTAPPAPVATLTASPTSIPLGNSSTLNYGCTNSTSASISPTVGSVTPVSGGSRPVSPTTSTTYTLTCTGTGGTDTDPATVTVTAAPLPNLTPTGFVPTVVVAGQPYIFTGTIQNVGTAATPRAFPSDIYACQSSDADCISNLSLSFWQKLFASIVSVARAAAVTDIPLNPLSLAIGETNDTPSTNPFTFDTPGQYKAELCADTPVTAPPVTVAAGDTLCTPKQIFIVCGVGDVVGGNPPACLPDLTASDVSPSSAIIATPVDLTAVITNRYADTGASFSDMFEIADDDQGTNPVNIGTYANADMAAGGRTTATVTHTFNRAGTYYVRACADKKNLPDINGDIVESDENNNCSADWVALTVAPVGTIMCAPSPATGKAGDSITWSATPSGFTPTSYAWSDSQGTPPTGTGPTFTNSYTTDGNHSVHLVAQPGNVAADCTAVGIGCFGTPQGTLTANPMRVKSGSTTKLTWTGISGDTGAVWIVQGTGGDTNSYPVGTIPASCSINDGGTITKAINGQTQYCLDQGGTQVSCVTVNVIPNYQEY